MNYRLAVIMPLLQGSFDDLLETKGSLGDSIVAWVIGDVAKGLENAWSAIKIVHLDLKPSDVLIKDQAASLIKVADWGISRLGANRRLADGFIPARSRDGYPLPLQANSLRHCPVLSVIIIGRLVARSQHHDNHSE